MGRRDKSADISVKEKPLHTGLAREELYKHLLGRRGEIEEAILSRVYGIADPRDCSDPEYLGGLRSAVASAIDFGLVGITASQRNPPRVPAPLLIQARVAARNEVSLDTVLRRYFAGYTLLGDFLVEEAEGLLAGDSLKRLLSSQARHFDLLLAAVSEEHARESETVAERTEERRTQLVEKILMGERLETEELAYDLEGHHIALIARGLGLREAVTGLAAAVNCRLLVVDRDEGLLWAWLGTRRGLDREAFRGQLLESFPSQARLALGEPGKGLAGWRLSHRQARAALPIALAGTETLVRYADVALLAAVLQDELLGASLRKIYLEPLEQERDAGKVARETLRAYFSVAGNVTSTAALLSVSRRTVTNRLRAIEERLCRPLDGDSAEIVTALRLYEWDRTATTR